jgi:F-type H+-transporting ATPase subunit a
MKRIKHFLAALAIWNMPLWTRAAIENGGAEAHGLPLYAVEVTRIGGVPITNSMIVMWGVALLLIFFARVATRNLKAIPTGAQNFWEWLVEGLYEFLEGIVGHDLVQKGFWFFASVFIFILSANWFGLIPGVGTIGWGRPTEHGFAITAPLLRGADADPAGSCGRCRRTGSKDSSCIFSAPRAKPKAC